MTSRRWFALAACAGLAGFSSAAELRLLVLESETQSPVPCRIHLKDGSGKPVQVRRSRDVFEIRFPGAPARTAIVAATVLNVPAMSVTPQPDGSFRVSPQGVGGNTFSLGAEHQFVIVVF